jgi:phytoene desaturase
MLRFAKNATIGGDNDIKREGFTFDMGPSWYWMPDAFERFFADFEKKTTDYYELNNNSCVPRIME